MTLEHIKATIRGIDAIQGKGAGGTLKGFVVHQPVAAGASTGSTYLFGRFPSKARIIPTLSTFTPGDITTATSLDIELGTFGNINGQNLGEDSDSIGAYSGVSNLIIFPSIPPRSFTSRGGKQLWELHNSGSLTEDPRGFFDIKATLIGDMISAGIMTCEFYYLID